MHEDGHQVVVMNDYDPQAAVVKVKVHPTFLSISDSNKIFIF